MKIGIVGLPNVGKSTLFNALTNGNAESANYPFCTIDPNVGIIPIPDDRLAVLEKLYQSDKVVPAFVEFVDIAGLVKGASKGEGLGNKFLAHIREVDTIVHLVRCFENKDIIHVDGSIDILRDIETINTELLLSDMESMESRIEKMQRQVRANNDKGIKAELELMEQVYKHIADGKPARSFSTEPEVRNKLKNMFLLTAKPLIYAGNLAEDTVNDKDFLNSGEALKLKKVAEEEGCEVIFISAKIEEELAKLEPEERVEFLHELGLDQSGLSRLIKIGYKTLGLFSFLTAGKQEVRAWTIPYGTKAPQAAGKIHTDFEKGFIRAEIVNYDDLIKYGSLPAARENGKVRMEGKEYEMKDGDVVLFKFNV